MAPDPGRWPRQHGLHMSRQNKLHTTSHMCCRSMQRVDTWLVRAFPANLCATPAPSGENKQDQLALGLSLGLGLGLPALDLVKAAVYLKNRPDRPSMLIDDNCPPADEPGRTSLVVVHVRSG